MQFHLNGYKSGDPAVADGETPHTEGLPAELDVLIVGCGPAGLTLAAQLAAFPGITTAIIDQKPTSPSVRNATAHGKRKATSRSKMMKRSDTR